MSRQISQLLSELEENQGFHFMPQEEDMEQKGTDEKDGYGVTQQGDKLLQLDLSFLITKKMNK